MAAAAGQGVHPSLPEVGAGPSGPGEWQRRRTGSRESWGFRCACFALPPSPEVQGAEEDKNQVSANVKLLLCCSHKALARSDHLVRQIGSLNDTGISDYLLWAGS